MYTLCTVTERLLLGDPRWSSSSHRLPLPHQPARQVQEETPLPRLGHRHGVQPGRLRHHLALCHPPGALAHGGAGGHHRLEQRRLRLHPRLLRQSRGPADGQPHDLRTLPS